MSAEAAIVKKTPVLLSGSSDELMNSIKKRVTRELVFAVSGQIGSGNSLTTKKLEKYLLAYGYTVHHIKLTDLAEKIKVPEMPFTPLNRHASSEPQRVEALQNHCDNIRLHYGCAALAQLAVLNISNIRREKLGSVDKREDLKFAYIIDSLKHPDEVRLLRQAYRTSFVLIGIETPEELRKARLTSKKGFSENDFTKLSMRDKDDDEKEHGQKVSLTVELSDIFLRNDCDTESLLEKKIERFTKLIVGTEVVTPTIHESSMYAAYSNAARSGCLSRQVGAVIVSNTGEIIATGTNDVPAFGGGQYTCELENDERCYNKGGECYNDSEKKQLYKEIYGSLLKEALVDPANEKGILRVLKNSRAPSRIWCKFS